MGKYIKIIKVSSCLECPQWMKCKPSQALTSKQRALLSISTSIPKDFILKGCPLEDFTSITLEETRQ